MLYLDSYSLLYNFLCDKIFSLRICYHSFITRVKKEKSNKFKGKNPIFLRVGQLFQP